MARRTEPTDRTPPGWYIAGTVRTAYAAGVDPDAAPGGGASGYLKSIEPEIDGFGTLMQDFAPDRYAGGRIRVSCRLKTADVRVGAGLWVRVDGGRDTRPLAFDNMEDRPVAGTTDWTECVVVLDVGARATNIAFGVLLYGTGTVWVDGMRFEAVDESVPVTGAPTDRVEPRNLDFAEPARRPTGGGAPDATPGAVRRVLRAVLGKSSDPVQSHCSFCDKHADAVTRLVAGSGVAICNECVELVVTIMAEADAR